MSYTKLSDAERLAVINEIAASRPTPEQLVVEAERNHWRSMVEAAIGLHGEPDPFTLPDTTQAAAEQAALEALKAGI